MLECTTVELVTSAAFMHQDDKGHSALKHHAALKGLIKAISTRGLQQKRSSSTMTLIVAEAGVVCQATLPLTL